MSAGEAMGSRRMQIIFMALLAALIIGRGLVGSPDGMTLSEVWQRIVR